MGQSRTQQLVARWQQQRPPAPCQQPGRRAPASFTLPPSQLPGRSTPHRAGQSGRADRAQGGLFPAPHQLAQQPRQQQHQGRLRGQVHYPSSPAGSSHQPPLWPAYAARATAGGFPAPGCTPPLPPPPATDASSAHPAVHPPAGSMPQQRHALPGEGPSWGPPPAQQPGSASHALGCTGSAAGAPPPPSTPMPAMHLVSRPAAAPGSEQKTLHEGTALTQAHQHPAEAPSSPCQTSQSCQRAPAIEGGRAAAAGEGERQADSAAGEAIMVGQQQSYAGAFGFAVKAGLVHRWLGEDILGTTCFLRQLQVWNIFISACSLTAYRFLAE